MSARRRGTKTPEVIEDEKRGKLEHLAFSTIIECALDPCYLMDAVRHTDGTIADFVLVHLNVSAETQLGQAREAVIGGKLCELYPFHRDVSPVTGTTLFADYVRVHETREPIRREIEVHDLPTGTRWYVQQVVPTLTGIAVMCRDVTRETLAERMHAELEQRMLRAQSMESVGMVAGGVAHDFGNLLLALGGFADLALQQLRDDPERATVSLEHVLEATRRATNLTRQLLVWSGRRAVAASVLDLNEVVARNVQLIRPLIPGSVSVDVEPSEAPIVVDGDEAQLAQVLLNLCLNARDAMPRGGTLTIRTLRARLDAGSDELNPGEAPGEVARLVVTDTGEGMDPSTLGRIFEPFYTTKPVGKGTGFGLALVYSIVRRHRGTVRVRSKPGEGTTFTVDLPLGAARPQKSSPERTPDGVRGGSETILIVDDDTAVRVLLGAALERAGYKTLVASNGLEAVEVLRRTGRQVDLVILDAVMPGMHGTETSAALRALQPKLRVLFSTAHGDEVSPDDGEPVTALLRKPYDLPTLLRAVRAVLDTTHA